MQTVCQLRTRDPVLLLGQAQADDPGDEEENVATNPAALSRLQRQLNMCAMMQCTASFCAESVALLRSQRELDTRYRLGLCAALFRRTVKSSALKL